MKITVERVHHVTPAEEVAPKSEIWLSNLDQIAPSKYSNGVYFYRKHEGSGKGFFAIDVMKDALAKALVSFYPYGGRLSRDPSGRLQITCNGEGVPLVEATCDIAIDDIPDFTPSEDLAKLIPRLNQFAPASEAVRADDMFSVPLYMSQVTFFKCGGVCVGVAAQHNVADGLAGINFTNTWSDIARGVKDLRMPPVMDRTALKAREPPKPQFEHTEYTQSSVSVGNHSETKTQISPGLFKFTKEHIDELKAIANRSSYKALAAHIWRSACIARGLEPDQVTSMQVPVDGRSRFSPPLDPGFFGNVTFLAYPKATSQDMVSKPLSYIADLIEESLAKMDDEYLRSSLDYLEVNTFVRNKSLYGSPNIMLNTWTKLGVYDADFGWGKPMYMGIARIAFDGFGCISPTPEDDGSVYLAIALQSDHMENFKSVVYQF